jgi:predicted ATPase
MRKQMETHFVEGIRSLIETKQLVRENNHWRVMGENAKISLPNSLRAVLSARIDRLPETTRHILQNAAVIGRTFDLHVLRRLTDLNGEFETHIQHLRESSLIEAARDEHIFRRHVQEAAYESILSRHAQASPDGSGEIAWKSCTPTVSKSSRRCLLIIFMRRRTRVP